MPCLRVVGKGSRVNVGVAVEFLLRAVVVGVVSDVDELAVGSAWFSLAGLVLHCGFRSRNEKAFILAFIVGGRRSIRIGSTTLGFVVSRVLLTMHNGGSGGEKSDENGGENHVVAKLDGYCEV